jgi:hypothetical protein
MELGTGVAGMGRRAVFQICAGLALSGVVSSEQRPQPPLLQQSNLVYEGAFRLPAASKHSNSFEYGGTALTYWPAHDSLLAVGHDWYQMTAEVSIPEPSKATTIDELPRAEFKQPFTDLLQGKRRTIDGSTQQTKIGGHLILDRSIVISVWSFYDAGMVKQTKTHFVTGQNFSDLGTTTGPFQVGRGFQEFAPDKARIGGFVSGYMSAIPPEWQSALGGTHLTGQGGRVSIVDRTSSGPSATVFTPGDLGSKNPAPGKIVMGYPSQPANRRDPLNHPTLGNWNSGGGLKLYDGTQGFRGMVFPDGTRSILFFGWGGSRFCYGAGTANKALDLQPVPRTGGKQHYCYDPTNQNTGTHGYPDRSLVYAYKVEDFIAAKQGRKRPWDVVPYTTWTFKLPFQERVENGVDIGDYSIVGAAYDPSKRRIFLSAYRSDGDLPLIHVFTVQ